VVRGDRGAVQDELLTGESALYAFRGRDGRPQDCVLIVHR
jgi:hypothetical protein